MENDTKIIKDLITGGVIGTTLGALMADDSGEGATIGAIAGAVLLATLHANKEAKKTRVPFYIQENNTLYLINPEGQKVFVRDIVKPKKVLQKHFILK